MYTCTEPPSPPPPSPFRYAEETEQPGGEEVDDVVNMGLHSLGLVWGGVYGGGYYMSAYIMPGGWVGVSTCGVQSSK